MKCVLNLISENIKLLTIKRRITSMYSSNKGKAKVLNENSKKKKAYKMGFVFLKAT